MYTVVLALHSLIRWAVILAAVAAVAVTWSGWLGRRPWSRPARVAGVALVASADAQVLLGLLLYLFLSPFAPAALSNPGAALADPGFRYWFLEHPLPALLVAVFAHLGSALARRAPDDGARWRRAALWYGTALAMLAVAVPWPFLRFGRPLWPF
jgi:hypothetical protein